MATRVAPSQDGTGAPKPSGFLSMGEFSDLTRRFPRTRYQGSKRRLAAAIIHELRDLSFDKVLDAFGGTGSVSYAFKAAGKAVTYNDHLRFNHLIGTALIENDNVRLNPELAASLGASVPGVDYGDVIAKHFSGIYFTDEENAWLDRAVGNIERIRCGYGRALAWFAVFQSALAKRPYNLFHRRNLCMRTSVVPRGFGNKTTWDRPFDEHVRRCVEEANRAVIDGRGRCRAVCDDVLNLSSNHELVYMDTPYISGRGLGVNYRDFYHFLEGMTAYRSWPERIDFGSKHRRLRRVDNPWADASRIREMFRALFSKFQESILVVSYRSDGIPSIDELRVLLSSVKRQVRVLEGWSTQYVLSKNRNSREVLLVGFD